MESEISDEEDVSDEDDGDSSFDSVRKHHPKGRTLAKNNVTPFTAKSTKPGEFSTNYNYPTTGDCLYVLHFFFIQTTIQHCLLTINTIFLIWFQNELLLNIY